MNLRDIKNVLLAGVASAGMTACNKQKSTVTYNFSAMNDSLSKKATVERIDSDGYNSKDSTWDVKMSDRSLSKMHYHTAILRFKDNGDSVLTANEFVGGVIINKERNLRTGFLLLQNQFTSINGDNIIQDHVAEINQIDPYKQSDDYFVSHYTAQQLINLERQENGPATLEKNQAGIKQIQDQFFGGQVQFKIPRP